MDMSEYMPHGHCILWNTTLLSMHVISDFLIFLSYLSIPITIFYFLKTKEIKNKTVPMLFIAFILSCAVTHIFTIWNWWHADYLLSGGMKIICALISSATAIILWRLVPRAVKIPISGEYETLLQENEDLGRQYTLSKEKNRHQVDFLASTAHELRNYVNVMNLSSQLLINSELDKKQESLILNMIRSTGLTLERLMQDILDLSKIEQDILEINYANFSLINLLNELKMEYELRTKSLDIEFEMIVNPSIPQNIVSDKLRIGQILKNLIDNAIKYSEKGKVTLNVNQEITWSTNKPTIKFTVSDQGFGIPSKDQEIIFETFTRSRVHKKIEGVGIGLSLSRKLSNLLGGNLELIKSNNEGTTFEFCLDTETGVYFQEKVVLDEFNIPDWKDYKILLADDAKENRVLYSLVLKPTKIQMDIVENGKLALNKAKENDYDVIILDLEMPEMGGLEAMKQIKALNPKIPVIAVTGYSGKDIRGDLKQKGFDGYIAKPISFSSLFNGLRAFLKTDL